MADDVPARFSLKRWSRRKLQAAQSTPEASTPPSAVTSPDFAPAPTAAPGVPTSPSALPASAPLPPIASLSFESDFSAFMQPKVEEGLKRQALKKLFSDPHFNVMDGLDTYIADYSIPDPIPAEMVREMIQSRYIFDPPQTRVNDRGFVEDVPPDEKIVAPGAASEVAETAGDSTLAPALPSGAAAAPTALPSDTGSDTSDLFGSDIEDRERSDPKRFSQS
jgi:hypothetical protein